MQCIIGQEQVKETSDVKAPRCLETRLLNTASVTGKLLNCMGEVPGESQGV